MKPVISFLVFNIIVSSLAFADSSPSQNGYGQAKALFESTTTPALLESFDVFANSTQDCQIYPPDQSRRPFDARFYSYEIPVSEPTPLFPNGIKLMTIQSSFKKSFEISHNMNQKIELKETSLQSVTYGDIATAAEPFTERNWMTYNFRQAREYLTFTVTFGTNAIIYYGYCWKK